MHTDKRCVFLGDTCPFFLFATPIQHALTPLSIDTFFANAAQVLIVFWHYFGQGGDGAMITLLTRHREVGCSCHIFYLANQKLLK